METKLEIEDYGGNTIGWITINGDFSLVTKLEGLEVADRESENHYRLQATE